MAGTDQLAAWVGQSLERINEAFRRQEDGHITRGAIAPS